MISTKTNSAKVMPSITVNFQPIGRSTDKERALLENVLLNTTVSPEQYRTASRLATLEILRNALEGTMLDLNSLAWILYEAGRQEGMLDRTNEKRKE